MDDSLDGSQVLETETKTEEVSGSTQETETTEETLSPEEIKTLREKAAKADELEEKNKHLFERAKKAEAKAPLKESDGLSTKDVLYVAKADIHSSDVDEILTYAKKMGVTVEEAHAHYKPILAIRAEERKTANATQTRSGARGSTKVSGAELLTRFDRTGEMPESDEAMTDLFNARAAQRLRKK